MGCGWSGRRAVLIEAESTVIQWGAPSSSAQYCRGLDDLILLVLCLLGKTMQPFHLGLTSSPVEFLPTGRRLNSLNLNHQLIDLMKIIIFITQSTNTLGMSIWEHFKNLNNCLRCEWHLMLEFKLMTQAYWKYIQPTWSPSLVYWQPILNTPI